MKSRLPIQTAYYSAEEPSIDFAAPLQRVVDAIDGQRHPPVHLWDPPLTGVMDLVITADGTWYYQRSPIARKKLVHLLASILRRDGDAYFLVTPSEKLSIAVQDAPFIVVELDVLHADARQQLIFRTNVGDLVIAGREHGLRVQVDPRTAEPRPYLHVRAGLEALLTRHVFYQLVAHAESTVVDDVTHLQVESDGVLFDLGISDDQNPSQD